MGCGNLETNELAADSTTVGDVSCTMTLVFAVVILGMPLISDLFECKYLYYLITWAEHADRRDP